MKIKKLIYPIMLFAMLAIPFIIVPRVLVIKEINCKSQYGPCRSQLNEKLDSLEGRSLQEVKTSTKRYLDEEVLINEYITKFQLPNVVNVELTEKKALYALKNTNQDIFTLISDRGHVVGFMKETNLPVIKGDNIYYDTGEEVSGSHRFALNILLELFYLYSVSSGNIQDDSLVVKLNGGERVIFPLEGDEETLVGSLQLVISNLKQEDKDSRIDSAGYDIEIDLRYKNPVIRKAQ